MRAPLLFHLSRFPAFWWIRQGVNSLKFRLAVRSYLGKRLLATQFDDARSLLSIGATTLYDVLTALLAAGVLQLIDPYTRSWLEPWVTVPPNTSDYVTFLAAVSSIGGVFIGLYYAATASVASAIYARVPNDVRGLLAQERYGNVYMRWLSFLTSLCLILIAFHLHGLRPPAFATPLITLASGIGIFAFVKLGQRAFNLFDPTALSSHLFEHTSEQINNVVAGNARWDHPSFQRHAHQQASNALSTLETLTELIAKEQHLNGAPLASFVSNVTAFLVSYAQRRGEIPTTSQWFEQVYVHRDWYRTDVMDLSIAIQSGTAIMPKLAGHSFWVEDRLYNILRNAISASLHAGHLEHVINQLGLVDQYIQFLAKRGYGEQAFGVLQQLSAPVLDWLVSEQAVLSAAQRLHRIAIVQLLAGMGVSIALGLRQYFDKLRRPDLEQRLSQVHWLRPASIYRTKLDDACIETLEWLAPRLAFEARVEGQPISPLWYCVELTLRPIAQRFVKNVDVLTKGIPSWFTQTQGMVANAHQGWLAASVLSRQWEYWHKLEHQSTLWHDRWEELSADRRMSGLEWAVHDHAQAEQAIVAGKDTLLRSMAAHQLLVGRLDRPTAFPDYAGQFLYTCGESLLSALIQNDAGLVRDTFPSYFQGCLLRFEKLIADRADQSQHEMLIATSTFMDLMDLSGYAYFFGELYADSVLWAVVRERWDTYLSGEHRQAKVHWLFTALNLNEGIFGIGYRAMRRTTWQQRVGQKLLELPRRRASEDDWPAYYDELAHPSDLVRIMGRGAMGLNYDGIDVFVALYLRAYADPDKRDVGWRRRDLRSDIARERNRRHTNPGGTPGDAS